jgi:hypothetical protein
VGVPVLETRALQWALLEQARQARAERAAAEEGEKGSKRGGRGQGGGQGARPASAAAGAPKPPQPAAPPVVLPGANTPLTVEAAPDDLTLEQLLAERDQVLAQRTKRRSPEELADMAALDL